MSTSGILSLALAGALVFAAASPLAAQQPQRATPPPRAEAPFNAVVFEESVRRRMQGQARGYAFVVADRDGTEARVSDGWAQAPGDGDVRMTTDTYTCVGSLTKLLSGIALLHLFEQRRLAPESVDAQLDRRIWAQLPVRWRAEYGGRNVERITYRHLLQHRTGFTVEDDSDTPVPEPMVAGVRASDVGIVDKYRNFDFKLLRYLIPTIAYPADVAALETELSQLPLEEYLRQANIRFSLLYEKYMLTEVLRPVLGDARASCRPETGLAGLPVAKRYSSARGTSGSYVITRAEHVAAGDFCASQGSWYLSMDGLARFARAYLYTDRLIGAQTRALMFQPDRPSDALIYSHPGTSDAFGVELGQRTWPGHRGDEKDYHSALILLPYGRVGVAAVNSDMQDDAPPLQQMLLDAYHDATRGQPIARAWHGLTPAKYQEYATELYASGHTIDWVDFYDVGGKVYVNAIFRPGARDRAYARHDLTADQYQREYDERVKSGRWRLKLVDAYLERGEIRYAFLMVPGDADGAPAYHGVDAKRHQQLFEQYTGRGYAPTSISIVVVDGVPRYATSWARRAAGGLMVRSDLDGREYQKLAEDMVGRGLRLAYLNAWEQAGQLRYSAIYTGGEGRQVLRHGLTSAEYQEEFDRRREEGYALRLVTAAGAGREARYAAAWER